MDYKKKIKINIKINKIIENHKDKKTIYNIFNICKCDLYNLDGQKKFSTNSNGIFFDLNMLSTETLNKLDIYLNSYISLTDSENNSGKLIYSPYSTEDSSMFENNGPKLSIKEKIFVKKKIEDN